MVLRAVLVHYNLLGRNNALLEKLALFLLQSFPRPLPASPALPSKSLLILRHPSLRLKDFSPPQWPSNKTISWVLIFN